MTIRSVRAAAAAAVYIIIIIICVVPAPADGATTDPAQGNNNTGGNHSDEHDEHKCPPEGEEDKRYEVAHFDFNHVRLPIIVAIWILFVTYAKIGANERLISAYYTAR